MNIEKRNELQRRTIEDIMVKLNKYGKCCAVRCPGFGKTYMMAQIAKRFNNVLFLYPSEIVKKEMEKDSDFADNITYMSYHKMARITDDELARKAHAFVAGVTVDELSEELERRGV